MPGLIDAHCHITFDEPSSNDELFFHRREGLAALVAAFNVKKLLLALPEIQADLERWKA